MGCSVDDLQWRDLDCLCGQELIRQGASNSAL